MGAQWIMPHAAADLFRCNIGGFINTRGHVFWSVIVQAMCWTLWLERNRRIFEDIEESLEDVWDRFKFRAAWWVSKHKEFKAFFVSDIVRDWSCVL